MDYFEYFCSRKIKNGMNLYIRYFDDETVVTNVEDALEFIKGFDNFKITPQFEKDFRDYAQGPMPYPKRYKVRARIYFIVIKTTATTLEEFKANGRGTQAEVEPEEPTAAEPKPLRPKDHILMVLNEPKPGWYEASLTFKRVVLEPDSGKHEYYDNTFVARVKAHSVQECYDRVVAYLQSRPDIDQRSQFPSAKGKNFQYKYLGLKPSDQTDVIDIAS